MNNFGGIKIVELPPLPEPFMAAFGRVSPEVYEPWAAQMQAYATAAVLKDREAWGVEVLRERLKQYDLAMGSACGSELKLMVMSNYADLFADHCRAALKGTT